MAVQYSDKSFIFLLFRWRGSVWKSTLRAYVIYLILYFAINLSYRFAMTPSQKGLPINYVTLARKLASLVRAREEISDGRAKATVGFALRSHSHAIRNFLPGSYERSESSRSEALALRNFWKISKNYFEHLVIYFNKVYGYTPIQFILGFYVSSVLDRWWNQLNNVAWPDRFLSLLAATIQGESEHLRMVRRTIARYLNLVSVLVWKEVSLKIKKRFPTDRHIIQSGLMTETEHTMYMSLTSKHGRWFAPISWTKNLLAKCKEDKIISDHGFHRLLEELWEYRSEFSMLIQYDWINIPLVYTQVVTLATYGYFGFTLIGRQAVADDSVTTPEMDIYFPFLTTLEFLFYVSWLKVGEELLFPFGEDDEDFDMNYILDRNLHVSFMIVDELEKQLPPLEKDAFWDDPCPLLPHTKASARVRDIPRTWRLNKVKIPEKEQEICVKRPGSQRFPFTSTFSQQNGHVPFVTEAGRKGNALSKF